MADFEQQGTVGKGAPGGPMELHVASCRSSHVVERAEVVASIRDVAATLIGSGEVAIFEHDAESGTLKLIGSQGATRWR